MNKIDENLSSKNLAALFSVNNPEASRGWLEQEEETIEYSVNNRCVVASFKLPVGGEVHLLDLSQTKDDPNIAVVYRNPHISRGRSPETTIMSPLELFRALKPSEAPPEILRHHHEKLSRRGIFDFKPRTLLTPLWFAQSNDLPPEYGPIRLCSRGNFTAQWAWFSMGHGVINRSTPVPIRMWTGWNVTTGTSAPRSAALCMVNDSNINPASALARYVILNKQGDGPWVNIYSSPEWTGLGEGVGYQIYGPDEGRTRIQVITQNNAQYYFWAGASWGIPQEWL